MENYFKTNWQFLKAALWDDSIDRVLFLLAVVLFLLDYWLWSKYLSSPDIYVYLRVNIYPIKLLAIMLFVNTFLAIIAHPKEKEIGYFLFISNIVLSVLVLILEIFYLSNL
ncbi:MAG: hypothetical protein Q7S80_01975 [bacterium]|nr:hypothetical protein [bacterium]